MQIRLYSLPSWAGVANVGFSLYISYVFAGGGQIGSRTVAYDAPYWQPLPTNVMGFPRSDEIFTVGTNRRSLQTGDVIHLRASDGNFVGIDHDEEDRNDSLVVNDPTSGLSNEFIVTVVQDPSVTQRLSSLNGLDPCGPPQAVTLLGRGQHLLSFPLDDGSLDLGGNVAGDPQTFAIDFLPDPMPHRPPRPRP